jgi:hypothetical protein
MFGNEILDSYSNPRIGYTTGLGYQFNFNHLFGIKTGVCYEQKGNNSVFPNMSFDGIHFSDLHAVSRISYLTLPLMVRISFGKKWRYFFNAGGYGGIYLQTTSILSSDDGSINEKSTSKNDFKSGDFGISGGFGTTYYFKNLIGISAEIRANYGLTNISQSNVYNDGTIQNFNACLLFGIRYNLIKKTQQNP